LRLDDHVIALGGGAVLRDENRAMIKSAGHKVFYLHCDADELHHRIQGDSHTALARPALTKLGGSIEEIRELLATRLPIYRQTMTAELDVTHLSADDVTIAILKML
jgi:shikimate kinase